MRVGDRGDKEKETKVAEEEAGGHEDPGSNKEIIEDTSAEDEHELTWGDIVRLSSLAFIPLSFRCS